VRIGTIIAQDRKANTRWRSHIARAAGRPAGMTGMALERAIAGLAARNPEYVVRG
jgi:hypothetical protein